MFSLGFGIEATFIFNRECKHIGNSMSTIPEPFKKRVFYSKSEELLHIILYLNHNNGCSVEEMRELFTGCEAQIPVLIDKLMFIRCVAFFKVRNDCRRHRYWVTERGLDYLKRKKIVVEF